MSPSSEMPRPRLDDLQLVDPAALAYAPSFIIRGLNDLPLRFRRRS